jgi:hypothetical protein
MADARPTVIAQATPPVITGPPSASPPPEALEDADIDAAEESAPPTRRRQPVKGPTLYLDGPVNAALDAYVTRMWAKHRKRKVQLNHVYEALIRVALGHKDEVEAALREML